MAMIKDYLAAGCEWSFIPHMHHTSEDSNPNPEIVPPTSTSVDIDTKHK